MAYPLCRGAAFSKGDDALAARRLLLGLSVLGPVFASLVQYGELWKVSQ